MTGTMFPASYLAGGGTGTVLVTRWGRDGLEPGDWIMPGGKTRVNYFCSFKWQNGWGNQKASFEKGETYSIPAYSIRHTVYANFVDNPIFKSPFNQRIYDPSIPIPQPFIGVFDTPTVIMIAPTVPIEDIKFNIED